jgi:3-phenylpropionate/trans-cinnamate dioxygenase ferredoxin subunit
MELNWVKIAESAAELPWGENGLLEIVVEEKHICLIRKGDSISGCAAKCPHAGAKMAEGYVDALGNVVCALHKYRFCTNKGRNVSGEGYFLKIYRIEVREDGVYVDLSATKTSNWLK